MRLFILISVFFIVNNVFGCSCIVSNPALTKEYIAETQYIIKGKVLKIEEAFFDRNTGKEIPLDSAKALKKYQVISKIKVTVKISSYFKTETDIRNDTAYIYTGYGDADCGYHFEVGKKYIIYGFAFDDEPLKNHLQLATSICLRTTNKTWRERLRLRMFVKEKFLQP
jgi:hypothetical protein